MSGYIISVMAATLVVALGGLISYGGSMARISRAAMAMILLYTVTLPIISLTGSFSELVSEDFFDGIRVEYDPDGTVFYDRTASAFSDGVKKFLCDKYRFNEGDVSISVRGLDIETMRAEKVIVILSGRAVTADARLVVEAVEDAQLGECEVKIDVGR